VIINTSQSRCGSVTVAGQKVYITQSGYQLSIDPQIAQIGSNAGAGEFGVAAPIDAVWEALVTQPWITIIGSRNGVGNGILRYTVAANTTGATRSGKIIVSGVEYTITQLTQLLVTTQTSGGGTVSGGGAYDQNASATLTATPATGYKFSHWTGDWVGSDNPATLNVDSPKTVTANFVPDAAYRSLAQTYAAEEGLYTTEQIHGMAMDKVMIDKNPSTGKMSVSFGILQRPSLSEGTWTPMPINSADVFIRDGKVQVDVEPEGDAAFYRLQGGAGE
jgi:hypothetical protein